MRCENCKHWGGKRTPDYEGDAGEDRLGECERLAEPLAIELLVSDWDAGARVHTIETPATFGCVLHEPTDESEGE